jgi:hypothetical protein
MITVMIVIVGSLGNFNIVASVARLVWRFASDKGLPFHEHFTYASFIRAQRQTQLTKH